MEKNIDELKKNFLGMDCLFITAGPSLKKLSKERVKELAKGKVVIAVKQAINFIPEIVDIHILNDSNYQIYDYKGMKKNLKVILLKSGSKLSFTPKCNPFIEYIIDKRTINWDSSLANTLDFKGNESLYNYTRTYGPGIMYELGIFLPLLFNSNSVIFVSWDLGSKNSNVIERFYEENTLYDKFKKFLIEKNIGLYNRYIIRIENLIRILLYYIGFNVKLGIPVVTINEANQIADSTYYLSKYYSQNNIEHCVYSGSSMLSSEITRI